MAYAIIVLTPPGNDSESFLADLLKWMEADPVRGAITAAAARVSRQECLECAPEKEVGH